MTYEPKTNIHLGPVFLKKKNSDLLSGAEKNSLGKPFYEEEMRNAIYLMEENEFFFRLSLFQIPSFLLSVIKLPALAIHATEHTNVSYFFMGGVDDNH